MPVKSEDVLHESYRSNCHEPEFKVKCICVALTLNKVQANLFVLRSPRALYINSLQDDKTYSEIIRNSS